MTTETRTYIECCNGTVMGFGVNLGSDLSFLQLAVCELGQWSEIETTFPCLHKPDAHLPFSAEVIVLFSAYRKASEALKG